MEESNYCKVCGVVDDHYDEYSDAQHSATPKHQYNLILYQYKLNRSMFTSNRDGIYVYGTVKSEAFGDISEEIFETTDHAKVRVYVKPGQRAKFMFQVKSEISKENILVVGIQLAHPLPQFSIDEHPYKFGEDPRVLKTKSTLQGICVTFFPADIGIYEMPIMFTFHRPSKEKNIIIIRDMVVNVHENPSHLKFPKSPYTNEEIGKAQQFIPSTDNRPYEVSFKIPKLLKTLFPLGLHNEDGIDKLKCSEQMKAELREVLISTRALFEEGLTEDNYVMRFHHLLWWEEIIARINLRKYNMSKVRPEVQKDGQYCLEVEGLAEKRPSLLRGDRVFLVPILDESIESRKWPEILFESIIGTIKENTITLTKLDESFDDYYLPEMLFNVKFLMSRVPMERMHAAVQRVFSSKQGTRIFPAPAKKIPPVQRIGRFYNELIRDNEEQRSAVEHIVSKTSGLAPYIVFGPPGTGKTMTIVEAIIQIVLKNPKHRVLVCTDSNMAADHIAVQLLEYNKQLNINNFILRANSQNREWTIMPPALIPVSNGSSYDCFYPVTNDYVSTFKIVVMTLLHSAKYGPGKAKAVQVSHLFIDEAAQALEPAALVPISNLLAPGGQLVLAGDPKQLGPVCISKDAAKMGLGVSLLERLWKTYRNLYEDDTNYITTLVNNFRSDPDILRIPNQLSYTDKPLVSKAKPDPLSTTNVLGLAGGQRAIVFHSVVSTEQRMGNAPSYFNEKELFMVERYIISLTTKYSVAPKDIGIIAPYKRQVYKMRDLLRQNHEKGYDDIEIGTVESFQGKEKRVILVSTVRANYRLLDYDAKYGLGFMVDDKRFNVALTRAKAKLIIIGNASCLVRDKKWRLYMDVCKEYDCYFGKKYEQNERTSELLREVAKTRFERCLLKEALELAWKKKEGEKKERDQATKEKGKLIRTKRK